MAPMTIQAGAGPLRVSHRPSAIVLAAVVATALLAESVWAAPYVAQGFRAIANARVAWVLLAVAAEMASMMTFARLQRVMLRAAGVPVSLRFAAATVFAGNAMSVTLPGGSVASVAYTSRRMGSRGASAPLIGFTLTVTGALSAIALTGIAAVGSTLDADVLHLLLAGAESATALGLLLTMLAMLHRPETVRRIAARGLRLARRDTSAADRIATQLSTIHPGARAWTSASLFAVANWTADLCCLLAAAHAVGINPSLQITVLAYTAAMAASSAIPLLPGGLGVVEATAVLALTHAGIAVTAATAAVLVYRLISLGGVAVTGWLVVIVQQAAAAARRRDSPLSGDGANDVLGAREGRRQDRQRDRIDAF